MIENLMEVEKMWRRKVGETGLRTRVGLFSGVSSGRESLRCFGEDLF